MSGRVASASSQRAPARSARELFQLVHQQAQELPELLGIGAITAAQIQVRWSHPGRFRPEAAFASFAGVAPIPASSGHFQR
ncbi:transposase [Streptomyces sp. NPDC051976]|uniref:transposase n=1 Tax=Streptomyces sp. NPDC051976 TaxID=3154947 RepID=UPI00343246ED